MNFLSLGAGVQSSVMLMRSIAGDIERPDHVLFADTGYEPEAVYRHMDWCERQCGKAGIPLHRVQAKMNMREEFEAFERGDKKYWSSRPPLRTKDAQVNRQCTRDAKILPMQRKQFELLGFKSKRGVPDGACGIMIGISTDEAKRAAPSPEPWYDRLYPLIDPLKMSRNDCQSWWERHFPHVPLVRSSCVICPYHSPKIWAEMDEADIETACDYDERIRAAYERRIGTTFYLHRAGIPLREALENADRQMGFDLDDEIYCSGGCGL